jgi:hypothetical protein
MFYKKGLKIKLNLKYVNHLQDRIVTLVKWDQFIPLAKVFLCNLPIPVYLLFLHRSNLRVVFLDFFDFFL